MGAASKAFLRQMTIRDRHLPERFYATQLANATSYRCAAAGEFVPAVARRAGPLSIR